jgi:hypothetical protein
MARRRNYRNRLSSGSTALVTVLTCACRAGERPAASADSVTAAQPADSLVASSGAGVEIWFTLARKDRSAEGTACVERALEIRRGDTRIRVPLLYTGTPPILLNDSTMRAQLWNHCRPVDAYLVDLHSGQPVRERSRSTS